MTSNGKDFSQKEQCNRDQNSGYAIASIAEFLIPPLQAAANNIEFNQNWQPAALLPKEQKLEIITSSKSVNSTINLVQQKV